MHIRTRKNMYFFTGFFMDTSLVMNFIAKIDTNRKYEFRAFIWYQNCVAGFVISAKILWRNL